MPAICARCQRANPREATYCYHDGALLAGRSGPDVPADGSAMNIGLRPFPRPFHFPSGLACHNFLQLTLALHEDPAAALDVLVHGLLETFFASLGRADLARAAAAAATSPNREWALDDLLGRLPASALTPARLQVEPTLIDLGVVPPGADRQIGVVVRNGGMRLLYGSASCAGTPWLAVGPGPEQTSHLFQLRDRAVLPIHLVGRHVRAFRRPQEAEIAVQSNGGSATIVVRMLVMPLPLTEGPLAGVTSPRLFAEKARKYPKEAAALVESGAVARWYTANGWPYPVSGPTASGPAALQQLFEALGLVKAPPVEISATAVALVGTPGSAIEYALTLTTQESRAVIALASCDQPWLQVGPTLYQKRVAQVPLRVAAEAVLPGATRQAQVTVHTNGRQRFVVPVTLSVSGQPLPPPAPPRAARARLAPALVAVGTVLLLGLLAGLGWQLLDSGKAPSTQPPQLALAFQDDAKDEYVGAATLTFGLALPGERKRLTYDVRGRTNNTCYRVDGHDFLLGREGGHWETAPTVGHGPPGGRAVWLHQAAPLAITQHVEIIAGPGSGPHDTCLVTYILENRDKKPHRVGLRCLLDTFVGAHDGVPFAVPGQAAPCATTEVLEGPAVPDFVQALEKDDWAKPGAIARLSLRLGSKLEPPGRVTLGAWPDADAKGSDPRARGNLTRWDVPVRSLADAGDSAVTLYWPDQELVPGGHRPLGFALGLGGLAANGRLAVAVGGPATPGSELTVLAYVRDPQPEEALILTLPDALTLAGGSDTILVPPGPIGLVAWKVRAAPDSPVRCRVSVESSVGLVQGCEVVIRENPMLD